MNERKEKGSKKVWEEKNEKNISIQFFRPLENQE